MDGTNWYSYCYNNPINFLDPNGEDAIIVTNETSVDYEGLDPLGHTSVLYQDENGEWYYVYWGDKAAAVIHIPSEYMGSLSGFNEGLNKFLKDFGYSDITSNYTAATYVVGDFTYSLAMSREDVMRCLYSPMNSNDIVGGYMAYPNNGDSIVWQGPNTRYDPFTNNCLQRTVLMFGTGTLKDGSSAATYLADCGYYTGMFSNLIPNAASGKFSEMFMNSSFTKSEAYGSIYNYAYYYSQGSPWAKVKRKGRYAYSVVGW